MNLKRESKNKLTIFSPAKLNLFFRVLSKRKDGYHEIASLMQAISFGDTLYFEKGQKNQLTSSDSSLPCNETNLIQKAVALFRQKTGLIFPVNIHIKKQIPIGGGLGGGSSNLATTLWALNRLSGNLVSEKILSIWASILSSDAPFFFSSGTAYCTGRGDIVESLPPLSKQGLWLAYPLKGLSTPLVYRHCKLEACSSIPPLQLLKSQIFMNDLEISAFALRPELKTLKEALFSIGFKSVTMTGSGSVFFCFGNIKSPKLSNVQFIPVSFFSRRENCWYNSLKCVKMTPYDYRAL